MVVKMLPTIPLTSTSYDDKFNEEMSKRVNGDAGRYVVLQDAFRRVAFMQRESSNIDFEVANDVEAKTALDIIQKYEQTAFENGDAKLERPQWTSKQSARWAASFAGDLLTCPFEMGWQATKQFGAERSSKRSVCTRRLSKDWMPSSTLTARQTVNAYRRSTKSRTCPKAGTSWCGATGSRFGLETWSRINADSRSCTVAYTLLNASFARRSLGW
jgi:hypothetical protein